jgi:Lon protease-like protein
MSRLPLFPLGFVLFPGTQAPLHIFEERYRALLRDVLAVDGTFGIIMPAPDGLPPTGALGVRARVVTHQPLPDGRSNLLVEGLERFLLTQLLDDPAPYPVGEVTSFEDEAEGHVVDRDVERQLRSLADRCRKAMATLADAPIDVGWSSDPAILSFQVAAAMPWDAQQARPLLAMRRADERVALLLRVLPAIVPDLEQRAAVHHRAGRNGKGPHGPTPVAHE